MTIETILFYALMLAVIIPSYLAYAFMFNLFHVELMNDKLRGIWWYLAPILIPSVIIGGITLLCYAVVFLFVT